MRGCCLLLAALFLAGCATMVKGPTAPIFIDSVPPGAEIEYGKKAYITPCMIQVKKTYADPKLTMWKDGFALEEIQLVTNATPLIMGNLFFTFPFGFFVDGVTASHCDFAEDNFRVQLKPVSPEEAAKIQAERKAEKARRAEEEKKAAERRAAARGA